MELTSEGLGIVLNAQGVAEIIIFVLLVLSGLCQLILPKKVKPWSWLWGKAMESVATSVKKEYEPVLADAYKNFGELDSKLDGINGEVQTLKTDNDKQNTLFEEYAMTSYRRQIIAGADELRYGSQHSDEWFTAQLDACSKYEQYCVDHPKYPNEKAKASIRFIREQYDELLRAGYIAK